ncbi:hypothetical protein EKO04_011204 [Ascochyta lentis]|uniref:Uncharacterized protein n=1 Tax=Ascochyta lentis TaxID=205686 RepID=A0A8H7ITJ3_9PLEO|nr:hypothetical protein EKO04_011204 [Ascochyta lentis]
MAPSTTREIVDVSWPMTIPAHARFSVTSTFPLKVSYPHNVSFTLTLEAPMLLSSSSPVHVIPFGVLSPGFTRGWSRLPTELKLAILRHNITYPSAIWPANANTAMQASLFPHLRMTPEIAYLSRSLFFAENTFIILSGQDELSLIHGFPPVSVRPLMRRVKLILSLAPYEWETVNTIAQKSHGFERLTYVEVQCSVVRFVRSVSANHGPVENDSADFWATQLEHLLPREVRFEPNGVVIFHRLRFGRGGADHSFLQGVEQVEDLVRVKFKFGVPS